MDKGRGKAVDNLMTRVEELSERVRNKAGSPLRGRNDRSRLRSITPCVEDYFKM